MFGTVWHASSSSPLRGCFFGEGCGQSTCYWGLCIQTWKEWEFHNTLFSLRMREKTFMLLNVSYFQTQSLFWRSLGLPLLYHCSSYVTTMIPSLHTHAHTDTPSPHPPAAPQLLGICVWVNFLCSVLQTLSSSVVNGAEQGGNEATKPHLSVCSRRSAGLGWATSAKSTRCDELHEKQSKFASQVKFGTNRITF